MLDGHHCSLSHEVHKIRLVLPLGFQFGQDGSSDDEVAEVVVVVLGEAKKAHEPTTERQQGRYETEQRHMTC